MRQFLGSAVIVVGLVACSRTPPATEDRARPSAEQGSPPAAPSAPPPADEKAAQHTGGEDGGHPQGRLAGGKKCEYDDAPGTATVTTIEDDATAGPDCKHAKRVTLSFAAADATAKPKPQDKAFRLVVGGVEFVATGCLKAQHIAVGTKLEVVRHTITAGVCQPLVYEVKALSSPDAITKCVAYCN